MVQVCRLWCAGTLTSTCRTTAPTEIPDQNRGNGAPLWPLTCCATVAPHTPARVMVMVMVWPSEVVTPPARALEGNLVKVGPAVNIQSCE